MMRAMFAAISGLKTHQVKLDVTANNIANVNTVGYKASRATFKDSLSQMQIGAAAPGPGQGGRNAAQVGLGVQLGSIDNLMGCGALQATGNVTDSMTARFRMRSSVSITHAGPRAGHPTRAGAASARWSACAASPTASSGSTRAWRPRASRRAPA